MGISRRTFLASAGVSVFGAAVSTPGWAKALPSSLNARDFGVTTGGGDQSRALQRAIDQAILRKMPLFLPGGDYALSNITLPSGLELAGVPGQTTLSYNGGGELLNVSDAAHVTLRGLSLNGNTLDLSRQNSALFVAEATTDLLMEHCRIFASAANCINLNNVAGRISNCEFSQARQAGLFSNDARGLIITSCHVHDCDNNAILVWRSLKSEDGTIVSRNRISNIKSVDGGSGQNGNGINIFRADNVIASENQISDCAFSAVRSNAGSACRFLGNFMQPHQGSGAVC